jgi:protoporphyrinogen oxidase
MQPSRSSHPGPVVIGAGPAGLTAALRLAEAGWPPVVLEADAVVGGISRTVERDGWRFDIGGHRFFTKVGAVQEMWHDLLPDGELLLRPRMSRIYYDGKFFDYPLRPANAFRNLGPVESLRCIGSYAWARVRPGGEDASFEDWVTARFGRRLYRTFFKTYTEKVWGVRGDQISADWAAQRIKGLSLGVAVRSALGGGGGASTTSLIEEFRYPRLGPGMMWEACADRAEALGARILVDHPVTAIRHHRGRAEELAAGDDGFTARCSDVISSMPLGHLVAAMDPAPPSAVLAAAHGLRHRDFLTVALVVPESAGFPDNWIYVHSPEVRLGRVQNYGAWSPHMVKPGETCLGLEYFVNEGDDLWRMDDDDLIAFGAAELARIGLLDPAVVQAGYVTRMPKAYPVYDGTYERHVATLRRWLDHHATNVHPVGRNGMHRYNNQDHSMLTAMMAVDNILTGAGLDPWSVNLDDDYHEDGDDVTVGATGRAAPLTA